MIVQLKNVRLGFEDLWVAKSINNGKPKFSGNFILSDESKVQYTLADGTKKVIPFVVKTDDDDNETSIMHKLVAKAIKDNFPGISKNAAKKLKVWCFNKSDGSTTRDEYTNEDGEYYGGFDDETFYVSAAKREDKAPGGKLVVLDEKRRPLAEKAGRIFSGCYVNALIDIYTMDNDDGKSVCASLEAVQLLRRGDALGFTPIDAASEFDDEECDEEDLLDDTSDDSNDGDVDYDEDDVPF